MRAPTVGRLRVGHDERFAVERIEALRDVAREFQMLRLIVADGHDARPDRAECRRPSAPGYCSSPSPMVSCACGFRLVLRHALQPADRRDAGQHPGEFGVLRDGRLHHE